MIYVFLREIDLSSYMATVKASIVLGSMINGEFVLKGMKKIRTRLK